MHAVLADLSKREGLFFRPLASCADLRAASRRHLGWGTATEASSPKIEPPGRGGGKWVDSARGGWRHFYSGCRFLAPIDGRGDGLLSTPDCDDGRPTAGAGMGLRRRRRRSVAAQGTAAYRRKFCMGRGSVHCAVPYPYGRAFFTSSSAFSSSSLHSTRPLRASTRLASSAASLATSAAASSRLVYLDRAMSGSGPLYW